MSTYIALLRAINVGGRNLVAMPKLRAMFESLGCTGVSTLLQSGNVIFQINRRGGAAIEGLLETETAKRLGIEVDYCLRSAREWTKVIAGNPFSQQAKDEPGRLVVMFLKRSPHADAVKSLTGSIRGRETVRCDGKHLYIVYPDGIGRSKLTGNLIEQKLGTRGTARNWNTILKIAELCG